MDFTKERRPVMKVEKISRNNKLNTFTELNGYDQYIAIDWSQDGFSLARLTSKSKDPKWYTGIAKVELVKDYLKTIRGKKILAIEETTSTHWLYVELKEYVNRILVCDPYRNKLLNEGAKNDDIDAGKLCILLRGGFLKEVYHSLDENYSIRKLLSAYEDLVKAGVRVKNQKSASYRALGLYYKKEKLITNDEIISFIELQQNSAIRYYEEEKEKYEKEYRKIKKRIPVIENMCRISGLDTITSVTIYGIVIDANRFPNKNKYWGYCGLAKHKKMSGKRNYGKRQIRSSRKLKWVYKTAALAAIGGKNDINEYYKEMIKKGYSEDKARHAVARYIAKVTYAMMKHGTSYIPYSWREKIAA